MIAAIGAAVTVLMIAAAVRPQPGARPIGSPIVRPRSHRLRLRVRRAGGPVPAGEVAAWCERLARVVRGGSTLTGAVCEVEPPSACRATIDAVVLGVRRGARLSDAAAVTTPSPHLNLALTVIRACAVNGGPPAEPLDRAAATLRGRAADAADRRTQSAQARLSALVMTILPVAMLLLLLATSSATREAAAGPAGLAAIGAGGALNVAGWRWMRRIIGRAAS